MKASSQWISELPSIKSKETSLPITIGWIKKRVELRVTKICCVLTSDGQSNKDVTAYDTVGINVYKLLFGSQ